MIVLADNPNSKGSQLESLTLRLLQHRNYRNCTANVMANGAEIDVRGELELAALGPARTQQLICECKAHKAVMDITQWCKFLGKVFHQEICAQAEVAGCFISLSGVNGHVQGNYDELRRHRGSITLVHGDDLLAIVREIIPFITLPEINGLVRAMTPRTASRFEPAYHEGAIYWIVVFSGGDFTVFTANGSPVVGEEATRLTPMVEAELDVSSFIDIPAEVHAKRRGALARTLVTATLFKANGSLKGLDGFEQVDDFSPQELRGAAQQLIDEGHLRLENDGKCSVPVVKKPNGDFISTELYRILYGAEFPICVLDSDFYQRHINRALLDEVCSIQQGMLIAEAEVDEVLELLQLSPSALAQALTPMQMIVTARKQAQPQPQVDRFHQDYFRQAALEAFERDFRNPALAEFYHENKALREIETTTQLKLKSEVRVLKVAEFTERVAIVRVADAYGGGFLHVAMLADAPQPWENWRAENSEPEGLAGDGSADHEGEGTANSGNKDIGG